MGVLFAVPHLYYALSWSLLGMKPSGTLNQLIALAAGPGVAPINLISWAGLILVMGLKLSSIIYMLLLGPMRSVDASLEESARMAGAGRLRSFVQIELPVLAPALLSATVLAFVASLGILDIPLILGAPVGIQTLSTQVFYLINTRLPADYAGANTVALLVMLCVGTAVLIQYLLTRGKKFTTIGGKSFRRARVELKNWRFVAAAVIAIFLVVAVVLPMAQLVLSSLQPYPGVYSNLSLKHYQSALANPKILNAFGISLLFGVVGGLIATIFALVISIVTVRSRSRLRRVPQALAVLILSVPGIMIALGVLSIVLAIPLLHPVYSTMALCMVALIIAFTPIANRLTVGAIAQLGPEMEEAARMSGAGFVRSTMGILVPLIMPTFIAAWFVVGVIIAGNFEMPALLSAPGTEPVTLLALQVFQHGSVGEATAISCLMLIGIAIPLAALAIAARLWQRYQARRRAAIAGSALNVRNSNS